MVLSVSISNHEITLKKCHCPNLNSRQLTGNNVAFKIDELYYCKGNTAVHYKCIKIEKDYVWFQLNNYANGTRMPYEMSYANKFWRAVKPVKIKTTYWR